MKNTNKIISILVASAILFGGCSSKPIASIDNNKNSNIAAENSQNQPKLEEQPKAEIVQKQNNLEKGQNSNASKSNDSEIKTAAKVERVIPQPPSKKNIQENIQINNNVKQVQVTSNVSKSAQDIKSTQTSSNSDAGKQNAVTSNASTSSGGVAFNAQGMPTYNYTVGSYSEYYNIIYNSLKNFEDNIYIKINNYNSNTYNLNVINKVLQDHYDIDYGFSGADATLYYMGNLYILNINYKYSLPKNTMLSMKDKVQNKAQSIITQIIKPGMTELQKELAVHDYIVNNTVYDYDNYVKGTLPAEVFTDYGVLINEKAVCEGYAKAMQRLLRMCGIESKAVEGQASSIPHAWNLVNINGVYTHVDSTWDDPVTPNRQNFLSHDYFNISDAKIALDHQWDRNQYPVGVQVK